MIHRFCGRWTAAFFLVSTLALVWVVAAVRPEWVPFDPNALAVGQVDTSGGIPQGQAAQASASAQRDGAGSA
ncbi:MAG: hypothetical protein VB071_11125, partial [Lawsonibacter sp.]|nr:hypothetical protein [Lawsonibacter sp.]